MPVYNPLQHLDLVLESLCSQTSMVDELVVTDDGSGEDVSGALRSRGGRLPFPVVYVRQPRRGSRRARCRNNGIRVAGGDLLFFLDQDIMFTPGYVAAFRACNCERVFLVAHAIRLSEEQTSRITREDVRAGLHRSIPERIQRRGLLSRYRRDLWAYRLHPLVPALGCRPKLRSGVFGIHRRHLEAVNGFDETYEGWGNEDDDLGRRLYRAGIRGRNIFLKEFPLHLHHATAESREARVNRGYYTRRKREIAAGDVRAPRGLSDPVDGTELEVVLIG